MRAKGGRKVREGKCGELLGQRVEIERLPDLFEIMRERLVETYPANSNRGEPDLGEGTEKRSLRISHTPACNRFAREPTVRFVDDVQRVWEPLDELLQPVL